MENFDSNNVLESLQSRCNYEVSYYNDNDSRNSDYEDDGHYHVVRNGHRFVFDVVQDGFVPVRVQQRLSRLVDSVLN